MKTAAIFTLTAFFAFGMASCSKDITSDYGVDGGAKSGKLAFSFEGINDGVTTYATVAAENFEKAVNDATVYIFEYQADKSGTLLLVQNETFTPASDYLVIVNDAANALVGKQLVAYFTINNGAAFNTHADLTTFAVGSTTEAQFAEVATTAIAGKVARTGFLMTSAITGSANFPNSGEYPTEVKRRVARFDIRNERPSSITSVNKITVRKAMDLGNVFGEATVAAVPTALATDVVYNLTANEYGADGASALAWVAGTDALGNDIKTASSVFYLNPTELLATTPENGTQIFIEATVGGATKVYEVSLAADIDIQANYRYILTLTDDLRFRITVADWTDADEIITTKPIDGSGFGIVAPVSGDITNGTFNATYNSIAVTDPTAAFSAALKIKGSSANGVTTQILAQSAAELIEVGADIITATAVYDNAGVTYAAPYFGYNLTIAFDAMGEAKNFTTIIRLTDNASGATNDILLHYGSAVTEDGKTVVAIYKDERYGVDLSAIKLGNLWWAPVNVGASNLSEIGSFFQWGRNYAFPSTGIVETQPGPISGVDAMTTYANKFIVYEGDNWQATLDNTLWNSINPQGPCPNGWRLPSNSECLAFRTTLVSAINAKDGSVVINDELTKVEYTTAVGAKLVFVSTSYRDRYGEIFPVTNFYNIIWTYDVNEAKAFTSSMYNTEAGVGVSGSALYRNGGFSVRCVKNAN